MAMTDKQAHETIRELLRLKQNESESLAVRIEELKVEFAADPHETTDAMIVRLISRQANAVKFAEALAIAVSKF
jgi:hypothetical protein